MEILAQAAASQPVHRVVSPLRVLLPLLPWLVIFALIRLVIRRLRR